MRWIICCMAFWSVQTVVAQSVSPEVIAAAGESGKTSSYYLQWTLGELAVESFSPAGVVLHQGYHQGQGIDQTTAISNVQLSEVVSLMPNPAVNSIRVRMEEAGGVRFRMYDDTGRRVRSGVLNESGFVNLEGLIPGAYMLELTNMKGERGIYTFVRQ